MTPSLATVPGKLLTMLFVTHHSDTLAPKQRHLLAPYQDSHLLEKAFIQRPAQLVIQHLRWHL
ncbi:hypothetical protein JD524_05840 [Aeromonas caviae]|uniref:hypothetical protein n=1 Tax=Aeromonas caviae TaxID=648 RepID=UPI00191FB50C|nr:hypothetical protein [Aeromonas caviae]MBL0654143.1 hypothetical protein [Aeromonas caviae]